MIEVIKKRCGIAPSITTYDDDICLYVEDCKADLIASGVPEKIVESKEHPGVLTALTFYVNAHIGLDHSDSEKYMDLYRKKVFRLTLEADDNVES